MLFQYVWSIQLKIKCQTPVTIMNENRQKVAPVTDLLEYKIRVGEICNEGGHEIFHIALKNVELVDRIVYILEMDLPEADTIAKVKQLV